MPLQIPHPNTPLHLYRHLLREATYLPAICRPWIASHIKARFRDCRDDTRPTLYIKQAHAALRNMRSANSGHLRRLERLCYMATGRIGKRKRILSTAQLARVPPSDTAELEQSRLEAVLQLSSSDNPAGGSVAPNTHTWLENWSIEKITSLARSQASQQSNDWPIQLRRQVDPSKHITGTNCFGQPFRPKRVQNRLQKHWAAVLRQLLPPLPQGEWDHLASVVTGDRGAAELKIPPRRPLARSILNDNTDPVDETWDWSQHVTRPARVIERGSNRRMKTLTGREDQDPRGHGHPLGVYVINPRKLQRIYSRVWEMSPTLQLNPKSKKWAVSWGQKETKVSAPSNKDLMFFEGVSENGGY